MNEPNAERYHLISNYLFTLFLAHFRGLVVKKAILKIVINRFRVTQKAYLAGLPERLRGKT